MRLDKKLLHEIGRYLLVGGLATVFDYLAFALFRYAILDLTQVNLLIATSIGFAVGLTFNYILSVIFVFKNVANPNAGKTMSAFVVFTIIGIIGLLITELGMWLGDVTRFHIAEEIYKMPEMVTKVIMTGIVLCWNYLARKFLIFKPAKEDKTGASQ
ncbi:MAG: GtrA family protein [Bacilli bacterium]|nr:GtrA family protein [Bacilli bacterium]